MQPSLQAHTPPMRQTPTSLCWTESQRAMNLMSREGFMQLSRSTHPYDKTHDRFGSVVL